MPLFYSKQDEWDHKVKWASKQDEVTRSRYCPIHGDYHGYKGTLGCKTCKSLEKEKNDNGSDHR